MIVNHLLDHVKLPNVLFLAVHLVNFNGWMGKGDQVILVPALVRIGPLGYSALGLGLGLVGLGFGLGLDNNIILIMPKLCQGLWKRFE